MYGSVKNDLILGPECRKCTLRGSDFKSFPGEHAPGPPYRVAPAAQVTPSPPTSRILPPTSMLIENPAKGSRQKATSEKLELGALFRVSSFQKCVSYLQEGINIVLNSPFETPFPSNKANVNFIDYKGTADWLARILKGIADRLFHDPIERTNQPTKLLKCLQEYESCLSAAINKKTFLPG